MYIPKDFHPIPDRMKPRLLATKIGFVRGSGLEDIKKRKSSLNSGNPFTLQIEAFPCDSPRLLERYWHTRFKSERVKGEWYYLLIDQRIEIQEVMNEYHQTGIFNGDTELLSRLKMENKDRRRTVRSEQKTERILNKPELARRLKEILASHRKLLCAKHSISYRSYISDEEMNPVMENLKMHPDAKEKIGCGVDKIFVQKPDFKNSYCFHVKRTDGSEEDYSYHAGLRPRMKMKKGPNNYTWIR